MKRLVSLLLIGSFSALSLGLSLELHAHAEGPHHHGHDCAVCHHLTTGSKAVVGGEWVVLTGPEPVASHLPPAADVPIAGMVTPAISPRAPPAA